MSSFWPVGFEISDTQSPRDILSTAQEEWKTNSGGILELVLQDTESESGNSMIIVHAKHVMNNRTAQLFSIVYQLGKPYPVKIQPEEKDLPSFLKKSHSKPSPQDIFLSTNISLTPQQDLINKWVSDTPSEFRTKLSEVFNLRIIKREILNLASQVPSTK